DVAPDVAPDVAHDVAPDVAHDVAPDVIPPPFCDSTNPDLALCMRFESSGDPGLDESFYGNDATAQNVLVVPGHDGNALKLSASSLVKVPDSTSLNVATLTIEAWINPSSMPSGTRAGILDNDGQYGFFLMQNGALRCSMSCAIDTPAATVKAGAWQHVACTYDKARVRVFLNGQVKGEVACTGDLGTGNANGTAIGMNSPDGDVLVGLMDSLRIWRVGRTSSQICEAAGLTCP
ncbi:MAG TPA: LamG domain-containing protein, partial [Polyangiaceae bacterium]|nr:LamG domain-containing protein [Polyangiaceae bacterium]